MEEPKIMFVAKITIDDLMFWKLYTRKYYLAQIDK